jgi:hypothetical protein
MDHHEHNQEHHEGVEEDLEEDFEMINPKNISDAPIIETYIRSDHYEDEPVHVDPEPLVVLQPSLNTPPLKVEKDLKEKKFVYIESEIEMSGEHNRQVDHNKLKVLIGNPMDDEVVAKAIAKVTEMQAGVTADGKAVPGGGVLNNPGTVVSGKKIKITQQMIEAAYQKLRTVIQGKKMDAESVAITVAYALQIANEMISTSKTYKVELALAIIRKLIDDEVDDPDQRVMMHMLVESTVPSLINTIQGLPSLLSKLFAKCCCSK